MPTSWSRVFGGALSYTARPRAKDSKLSSVEDQDDLDRLESVRSNVRRRIASAGYRSEAIQHAFETQLEITEFLVQTKIEARRILRDGLATADSLNNPSAILSPRVIKLIKNDVIKLVNLNWIALFIGPVLKVCGQIVLCCTAIHVVHLLTERDRPEVEALLSATRDNPVGWTAFMSQNDLVGMASNCARYPSKGLDAQGRPYCFVPVLMNHVNAAPSEPPTWARGPAAEGRSQ